MGWLKKYHPGKYIDFKIGLAGGLVMGIIVYFINYQGTENMAGALTAALKQGVYTFFFGGIIMKLSENLATGMNPKFLALFLAMLIPSLLSLGLTFGLHSMKGTPKPVESTIPTAVFVIPSTLVWGILKRRKKEKSEEKNTPPS